MIITIDGPAGAGKSSVSKKVAEKLGLDFLDTGALYRALAYALDKNGIPPLPGDKLDEELEKLEIQLSGRMVLVNGTDVSKEIRAPHVDRKIGRAHV